MFILIVKNTLFLVRFFSESFRSRRAFLTTQATRGIIPWQVTHTTSSWPRQRSWPLHIWLLIRQQVATRSLSPPWWRGLIIRVWEAGPVGLILSLLPPLPNIQQWDLDRSRDQDQKLCRRTHLDLLRLRLGIKIVSVHHLNLWCVCIMCNVTRLGFLESLCDKFSQKVAQCLATFWLFWKI